MKTTRQTELASSTQLIKTILLTTCLLFCSFSVWGQAMRVGNNGVSINIQQPSTTGNTYGVHSVIRRTGGTMPAVDLVGVRGSASSASLDTYLIRHIGVLGTAHHNGRQGTRRMAIGVAGLASTTDNSIGIFGGQVSLPSSLNFSTLFAGYFIGPVNVRGTLTVNMVAVQSDEGLKQNIQSINNDAVERLFSLRPVKYNLQQIEMPADSMTAEGKMVSFTEAFFDETSIEFNTMHFGLIAQELQEIFPDLVVDRGEGFLAINYIGLIPIMLKAIQRQQQEIDELRSQRRPGYVLPVPPIAEPIIPILPLMEESQPTSFGEESLPITPTAFDLVETQNKLFQNVPNPFNRATVIEYRLAENATNARISIFNLNGRQLLSFELPTTQREGSIEVCASSLQPGMYIYALIVDGVIIDTKRMVLMD